MNRHSTSNKDDANKNISQPTENKYVGVNIDKADNEKVSKKAEKEWTKELNNNPRNNGKLI